MSAFLSHHFSEVADYSFTADLENEVPLLFMLLDNITSLKFYHALGNDSTFLIAQSMTVKHAVSLKVVEVDVYHAIYHTCIF